MKFEDVKHSDQHLLLRSISGSKAYGLDGPQSDTDYKGIFVVPRAEYYGLDYPDQLANESNDEVYYELRKFIGLLVKNNPNMLDLLFVPEHCVLYKHPLMNRIRPEQFLSRLCRQTFAGYAMSQIKKAKGLNKKILNPVEQERKSLLNFCFVWTGQGTQPVEAWLRSRSMRQEYCGLVGLEHMRDLYALYYAGEEGNLFHAQGICSGPEADEVSLSSVPKTCSPLTVLYVNKDGYSSYCKDYRQYWDWAEKRNETRYEGTLSHGKNYDAKNMMHVFRLLNVAEEIALEKTVRVVRPDRDFLLKIKSGAFAYEDLISMAQEKMQRIEEIFAQSDLPESPDEEKANELLIELRAEYYNEK